MWMPTSIVTVDNFRKINKYHHRGSKGTEKEVFFTAKAEEAKGSEKGNIIYEEQGA